GIDRLAASAADAPVIDVHKDVGADLQLGKTVDRAVDVVRPRAAAGENLCIEARLLQQLLRLNRFADRFARNFLPGLEADGMRRVARVRLNTFDLQPLRAGDLLGEFHRRLAWK